jgi:thiol-disulfide isomerase/thioredoxin
VGTKARARQRHADARPRGLPLFPIVIGVIAVALLGVVIVSAVGDDDSSSSGGGIEETRPVTVTGDPLAPFANEAIEDDPAVGATAPIVIGSGFSGDRVVIADDGRPKAVAFVAHWCPHCQSEIPRLAAWLEENDLPDNVDLIIVASSTSAGQSNYPPSEWLADAGLSDIPTIADNESSDALVAFGAGGFPYWVYLDEDHQVVARTSGEYPDDPVVYTTIFEALAAGDPVTDLRRS